MSKRKPSGFWNKENCLEAALKCKTRTEFRTLYSRAWSVSKENGWLEDFYAHMESKTAVRGYWQDYDRCYNAAKQCVTASEFGKRFNQAYRVSLRENWRKDYTWFVSGFDLAIQKNAKWTYETCAEESKKYKTRSEFHKGAAGAYQKAFKKGWLDDYVWLNRGLEIYGSPDCVYKYEFKEYNAVYIGRTINRGDRHWAHIFGIDKDAVARFAYKHNIPVPEMEILAENITLEEGQHLEDEWVKFYKAQGFKVLNKAKTGKNKGSLGAIGWGKWTYETCYQEAQKYKTRKEFQRENVGAYTRALQYKWLDDYTWFKPAKTGQTRWTKQRCYDEAKKYFYIEDFRKLSTFAYEKSKKNGWLRDYEWLSSKKFPSHSQMIYNDNRLLWTEEKCYEEAKKYVYIEDFRRFSYGAYKKSRKRGWLGNYNWLLNKPKQSKTAQKQTLAKSSISSTIVPLWSKEKCYKEAQKYVYIEDFRRFSHGAYKEAIKSGWLETYDWLSNKPKQSKTLNSVLFWTKERCYEEAKKYKTRTEFQYAKGASTAYKISVKNGWIEEYEWMQPKAKPNGYWDNYKRCFEEAKKYKTRTEFQYAKGASRAYKYSVKNGWIDDFTWMQPKRKKHGYWTKERCFLEYKKYLNRDFGRKSPSAYAISQRNGWLKEFREEIEK